MAPVLAGGHGAPPIFAVKAHWEPSEWTPDVGLLALMAPSSKAARVGDAAKSSLARGELTAMTLVDIAAPGVLCIGGLCVSDLACRIFLGGMFTSLFARLPGVADGAKLCAGAGPADSGGLR